MLASCSPRASQQRLCRRLASRDVPAPALLRQNRASSDNTTTSSLARLETHAVGRRATRYQLLYHLLLGEGAKKEPRHERFRQRAVTWLWRNPLGGTRFSIYSPWTSQAGKRASEGRGLRAASFSSAKELKRLCYRQPQRTASDSKVAAPEPT